MIKYTKDPGEPLEVHYLCNATMKPLAEGYFLATMPGSLKAVEHFSCIQSTGNYMGEGYAEIVTEKTSVTLSLIEKGPSGSLFVWSDVDIVFLRDCEADLRKQMGDADIMFQREWGHSESEANTGFQVIRRSEKTADFYRRLLNYQRDTQERRQQPWVNKMLRNGEDLRWGLLPLSYSAESNRGLSRESWIYHANCTISDSINRKCRLLDGALNLRT